MCTVRFAPAGMTPRLCSSAHSLSPSPAHQKMRTGFDVLFTRAIGSTFSGSVGSGLQPAIASAAKPSRIMVAKRATRLFSRSTGSPRGRLTKPHRIARPPPQDLSLGSLGPLRPITKRTCGGAATAPDWPTTWTPPFPVAPRTTWHGSGTTTPLAHHSTRTPTTTKRPSSGTRTPDSSGDASPSTSAARPPSARACHSATSASTLASRSPRSPSTRSAEPSTSTP